MSKRKELPYKRYLVDIRDTIVLVLHEHMHLNGQDIAEIMGMHRGTVSRIVNRGQQQPTLTKTLKKKLRQ
jgi:DNA-directed RNA polymerase specialized sigma24 family protein